MCYKIVFGLINVDCKNSFSLHQPVPRVVIVINCLSNRLVVTAVITFFASRVVPVWNSLPSNIVNFSTLPKFKTSLFLVDLSKFLKYQLD